jgi:hypothetical protein
MLLYETINMFSDKFNLDDVEKFNINSTDIMLEVVRCRQLSDHDGSN